jgi:hypothetical protein
MSNQSGPSHSTASKGATAILVAGLVAGSLDIAQALFLFGPRVPLSIAAGLIGQTARRGGPAIYLLGLVLHFTIATSFAGIYYLASRKLHFLLDYPIVCGLLYGLLVDLSMTLIVLPLSALHAKGPYPLTQLLLGIGVHMITIGLPIAFTMRRLAKL